MSTAARRGSLLIALIGAIVCAWLVGVRSGAGAAIPHSLIQLGPFKPAGLELQYSYGAIGVDPQDRVYALFCSDNYPADCALFQYDTQAGQVRLLGSLRETASKAGNLGPNANWGATEQIVKGHTHLPHLQGKIYIGTQEFHDIVGDVSVRFAYRGSHIFAYDIASDTLSDLSAAQPKGVFQEHQGIIALTALPQRGLIVGFSHPLGDVLLYDVVTAKATVVPGITAEHGNSVAREIVATPSGLVLFSYGFGGGPVYRLDLNTYTTQTTSYVTDDGFWNGQAQSADGEQIYISTYGNLYFIDGLAGTVQHLGPTLPPAEHSAGQRATLLWGLAMSRDEQKLYWIPSKVSGGPSHGLYEHDTVTGQTVKLLDLSGTLGGAMVSGSNIRDSQGRIYFVCHTGATSGAALLQLDVSSRSGPAPPAPQDAGPDVGATPDAAADGGPSPAGQPDQRRGGDVALSVSPPHTRDALVGGCNTTVAPTTATGALVVLLLMAGVLSPGRGPGGRGGPPAAT